MLWHSSQVLHFICIKSMVQWPWNKNSLTGKTWMGNIIPLPKEFIDLRSSPKTISLSNHIMHYMRLVLKPSPLKWICSLISLTKNTEPNISLLLQNPPQELCTNLRESKCPTQSNGLLVWNWELRIKVHVDHVGPSPPSELLKDILLN